MTSDCEAEGNVWKISQTQHLEEDLNVTSQTLTSLLTPEAGFMVPQRKLPCGRGPSACLCAVVGPLASHGEKSSSKAQRAELKLRVSLQPVCFAL